MAGRLKRDVNVTNLELHEGISIADLRRVVRFFREVQPAIVHAHGWGQGSLYGVIGANIARVPIVINGEHGGFFRKPVQVVAQRLLASFCDITLSVSRSLVPEISANLGIKTDKIRAIPNGVDVSLFHGRHETVSLKRDIFSVSGIDIHDEGLTIGCIGSLKPQKNQIMLIEALALLKYRVPDNRCRIIFVGDGPDRGMLEELVGHYRLKGQVAFLGIRSDVSTILSLVDVLALTSIPQWEGLSNVVLEAMSSGKPVISTRSVGAIDLIDHGENGLLIEGNDTSSLTRALEMFMRDPGLLRVMGERARRLIVSEYSIEQMVFSYDQVYTELLKRRLVSR
jgi:glycosyltransferase involved in cell wall biosynthesis